MAVVAVLAAAMLAAIPPAAGAAPVGADPSGPASARPDRSGDAEVVPGELLVQFEPGVRGSERAEARDRNGLAHVRNLPLVDFELVRTGDRTTPPEEQAERVQRDRAVRLAEPNFVYHPAQTLPDDPEFGDLWGLHNTGQMGGTADADIDAPEAWEIDSDQSDLVVAVTDTGVWADHPDLAGAMWTNPDETPDDDTDNDGNELVDDVHGYDFFNDDGSVFDEADPDDHGTHVAGTIAAVADNGTHVAGVSNARIMALKFIGPTGGSADGAIAAIAYAVDKGADVINASWGGGMFSEALRDAIEAAGDAGILFVAAAGNAGSDNDASPSYPASYDLPNIISVAATTRTDALASFSNFGETSVDLGAPGQSILSTVPQFAKAVLTGPDTPGATAYHSAFHSFGLEGVLSSSDREALLGAALDWAGAVSDTPILLVDDDGGASFEGTYEATLTDLGYTDVTTETVPVPGPSDDCGSHHGPDATTMAGNLVIWFTGTDFGCWSTNPFGAPTPEGDDTLTETDQSNLTTHLNDGEDLLLFGQDIGFDLTDDGTTPNTLLSDTLNTGYISDLDLNFDLVAQADTAYAALPTIELSASGSSSQLFSDALLPLDGADAGLRGSPTTWFSGTSMAAPHVSGAAAVVHATYPGLGHLDVKARLLDLGDPLSDLDGKTVSGKRLNLASALEPPTVPGAPTDVSATAGDGQATVSWTPPEDDGHSDITEYTITTYEGSNPTGTTTASGSATSKTVAGLTNGTTYTFTVYATNGVGDGPESDPSNAVTPEEATVPGAPTDVSATAGDASATVSWTPPADDGGSAITEYTITTYEGSNPTGTTTASGSATSKTVTGLTNGTTYTFTVYATNDAGDGPESDPSNAVTPLGPPGAPTGVSASAGDASATVSWTAPADDGGSAITSYTITTYDGSTPVKTTSAGASATSKTVNGLTNGTTYTFTVYATNDVGDGPESSATSGVTPKTVPDAPTNVSAVAGEESAKVSWKAPADNGGSTITKYTVTAYKGSTSVGATTASGSARSKTVTGLDAGATYTFTVKATNGVGTGPASSHSQPVDIPLPRSGYWMLGSPGNVHAFGDAGDFGSASLPGQAEDIEPSPSGNGYWVVDAGGYVGTFGDAAYHGGLNGALQAGEAVTAMSATPTGDGYWLFTNFGRVATFGAAPHLGDMTGVALNGPVLDSVATPSGKGYYMVGSDGGIFAFGDAAFYGSMGGIPLNAPVQSLVPDGDGTGYWLVASDGGIFAFEAPFHGSMGDTVLNQPVTGMVASGSAGYLMVASDGGIFAFGSAPFHGSLGANPPPYPIVSVAVLRD